MEQREICRFKIGHLNRFEIEQAINTIVLDPEDKAF
jgi:hypothetical protein